MTLSIEEYSNLKRCTTSAALDLGAIIVRTLERELGEDQAERVLFALDRAVSPAALEVEREFAQELKKVKARQEKVQRYLSKTEGIAYSAWAAGRYLVTHNGEPIGSVHAAGKVANSTGKRKGWVPSPKLWYAEPFDEEPCRTVDEASIVVWDWWHRAGVHLGETS